MRSACEDSGDRAPQRPRQEGAGTRTSRTPSTTPAPTGRPAPTTATNRRPGQGVDAGRPCVRTRENGGKRRRRSGPGRIRLDTLELLFAPANTASPSWTLVAGSLRQVRTPRRSRPTTPCRPAGSRRCVPAFAIKAPPARACRPPQQIRRSDFRGGRVAAARARARHPAGLEDREPCGAALLRGTVTITANATDNSRGRVEQTSSSWWMARRSAGRRRRAVYGEWPTGGSSNGYRALLTARATDRGREPDDVSASAPSPSTMFRRRLQSAVPPAGTVSGTITVLHAADSDRHRERRSASTVRPSESSRYPLHPTGVSWNTARPPSTAPTC